MIFLHNRNEKIVAGAALLAVGFFIALTLLQHGFSQPFSQIESDGYLPLAVNLYEHQSFSYSTTAPFVPEALQVPGYPLFLAVFAAPFDSVIPALVVQAVLWALAAVLLYRLGAGLFSSGVRFWAAVLFAIEPFGAFTAAMALSEALFMFLFIGGLYLLRLAVEEQRLLAWAFAGLVLGMSILVRPIALYVLPLIFLLAALWGWRLKQTWPFLGLVLAVICLVTLPGAWVARNYADFGVATISTKGPFTLYFYDVEQLLEYRDHQSPQQTSDKLFAQAQAATGVHTKDELRSPRYAAYLQTASFAYLKSNPALYAKLHVMSVATFFFSDGYRLLLSELGGYVAPLPNITKSIAERQWRALATYFSANPFSALLFAVGSAFWGLVALLAAASPFFAWRTGERRVLFSTLFFIGLMVYFALLTGPVAQARYRIVIEPFLFVLMAYSLSILFKKVKTFIA